VRQFCDIHKSLNSTLHWFLITNFAQIREWMRDCGLKFIYAPCAKCGSQRADFHKIHSHSTIFAYILYDIFYRFCKIVQEKRVKCHFRSNKAFTAQNVTILGTGKRKYVKVSYAGVKGSTRRNLFTPLRKVWLSPSRTSRNSRLLYKFL
jgi:hypothetical protein